MIQLDVHTTSQNTARVQIGDATVAIDHVPEGAAPNGLTPENSVLAGLAACAAITMQMYARRKGWPLEGVRIQARLDPMAEGASFEQVISLDGQLEDEQRERLRQIAGRCPVHRLLERQATFVERLAGAAAEPA